MLDPRGFYDADGKEPTAGGEAVVWVMLCIGSTFCAFAWWFL